jgi:hypothetical protein
MSDTDERSCAARGSQVVAWAVEFEGEAKPFCLSFDKGKAIAEAAGVGKVFSLHRLPLLTAEEREAFALAAEWCRAYGGAVYDAGHVIDRFLERTKEK